MENTALKKTLRGQYQYGFHDDVKNIFQTEKGLSESVVRKISQIKNEPDWMLQKRLQALKEFLARPMPAWGADLSTINFDDIIYYARSTDKTSRSWDEVPDQMKKTFEKLGIPEAEQKFLAGAGAQYDSESVYHRLREDLEKQGVVFLDMDSGLREHEEVVKKYFGTVIPSSDNKFAALNTAVWSGGSFLYVPKGVRVEVPLQAYFRINTKNMGQFERTMIIAEPGSSVHYLEGCFTKGTPIQTYEGIKPIEEVDTGEGVLTHRGRYRSVKRVQKRPYTGKLLRIRYWGDSDKIIQATHEHPFYCVKKQREEYTNTEWNARWVNADQLDKNDYLAIPIDRTVGTQEFQSFVVKAYDYRRKEYYTKHIVLDTDADFFRLIGYYLAEGTVTNDHYLNFTFNVNEREYIEDVKQLLQKYFNKKPLEMAEYNHGVSLILCSTDAARVFSKMFGKHAQYKRLPKWVLWESPKKQSELIKGYWRGDGSYMSRKYASGLKNNFRINTVSVKLAYQIRDILLRLDIFAGVNRWKKTGNRKDSFALVVGGKYLDAFSKITGTSQNVVSNGDVQMLMRQRNGSRASFARIVGDYAFVPIRSIEVDQVTNIEVYNFSMDEDESYVAGGVAVHNCSAPVYTTDALHSAVVEIIAMEGSRVQYTTIQNWSNDVYNLVTKRAKAYKDATVFWLDGNLGCLTGDAKIFTNNDVKDLKNVQEGETVFSIGPDLTVTRQKVLGKKVNPERPVYRIRTENHREVKATDNHPFLVLHKKGKLTLMRWTPLAEIKTGDYVGVSGALPDMGNPYKLPSITQKRAQKKIRIPAETSTELMWLLGFYLGDGYPDNARVCFACPPSDRSHEKVIKTVQDLFGLCHTQAGVVIRINSISFVRWIRDIGFIGNARTKRVPGWVFRIPHEQKKALIEGYVAADGYFRKGHKNISITSVNRPLLEDIKTLSLSCGLSPSKISRWVRREKKPLGKEEKTYEHYFLYFAEQLPETSIQFTKVSEIIPCGNEVTYDIEVDGSHNFIANGIFVHNSKVTMKYPSVLLMEPGARGEVVSIAFAGKGQHQDAGAKIFHLAPNTSSLITSKSVSKDGGRTTYRGLLHVSPNACGVKSNVECDALILDEKSASDTVPYMQIHNDDVSISHEASVSKLDDEKLFYLRSRGFTEKAAKQMLVQGFMEPFIRHLPMEYAVELNRLIDLEMEGSVG